MAVTSRTAWQLHHARLHGIYIMHVTAAWQLHHELHGSYRTWHHRRAAWQLHHALPHGSYITAWQFLHAAASESCQRLS